MTIFTRWAGAAILAALIASLARGRRSLTVGGAVAATFVGTLTFAPGGLSAAAALVTFFVTSSALSHFKEAEKARRGVLAQAKGGERDALQVLANGGVATLSLALAGPRGAGAFLGALATAGADTWATELGLLAGTSPRLLTTLRRVPPGTSGAITVEGTLASIAGATVVGAAWSLAGGSAAPTVRAAARALLTATLAGTLGALVDSLLGATLQAVYHCPACSAPTETRIHARCGRPAQLVRGLPRIDNDAVNALATLAGALLGTALWQGFRND